MDSWEEPRDFDDRFVSPVRQHRVLNDERKEGKDRRGGGSTLNYHRREAVNVRCILTKQQQPEGVGIEQTKDKDFPEGSQLKRNLSQDTERRPKIMKKCKWQKFISMRKCVLASASSFTRNCE